PLGGAGPRNSRWYHRRAAAVGVCEPRQGREAAALSIPSRRRGFSPGRIAQRESARFTRGRSLVRSQVRPPQEPRASRRVSLMEASLPVVHDARPWKRFWKRARAVSETKSKTGW